MRFAEGRWQDYNRHLKLNRHRKTDFAVGIVEGFRKRLQEQTRTENKADAGLSLVKLQDRELERLVAYRYPRLRQIQGRRLGRDERIHRDGVKIGRTLVLHKAIETHRGTVGKRLLPCRTQGS
jgi:hypothetical protein